MIKTIAKSILITSLLSVGALAYEASDVKVNWKGYKLQTKDGVPGTFDKVTFNITKNDDFAKFLTSANVSIDPYSINSKVKFRDNNISSTLFKLADIKEIKASIKTVKGDDTKGVIDLEIMMNNITKVIPLNYTVENSVVKAEGEFDLLKDFSMNKSFEAFAAKCKPFHAGKTWSSVTVGFELPFTK